MDLRPYIDNLRSELAVAAEGGGEQASALADRLLTQIEAATRLTMLDLLAAAADEITRELAPGSVHVRLLGREPAFVVMPARQAQEDSAQTWHKPAPPALAAPAETDEGGTSRINLRLPDHLKASVDEAASRAGLSVNAWLVRAVATTLESADHERGAGRRGEPGSGQHVTGWVR